MLGSVQHRTNTLVAEVTLLGCLSIHRQEEHGFFDQQKSQTRENTHRGIKRDKHASWFAEQQSMLCRHGLRSNAVVREHLRASSNQIRPLLRRLAPFLWPDLLKCPGSCQCQRTGVLTESFGCGENLKPCEACQFVHNFLAPPLCKRSLIIFYQCR